MTSKQLRESTDSIKREFLSLALLANAGNKFFTAIGNTGCAVAARNIEQRFRSGYARGPLDFAATISTHEEYVRKTLECIHRVLATVDSIAHDDDPVRPGECVAKSTIKEIEFAMPVLCLIAQEGTLAIDSKGIAAELRNLRLLLNFPAGSAGTAT